MAKIVIIGGSFGGLTAGFELKRFLGKASPETEPVGALCIMDMGNTATLMKAYPVLPPRREAEIKAGIRYKWAKQAFEKYYLWKIRKCMTQLP